MYQLADHQGEVEQEIQPAGRQAGVLLADRRVVAAVPVIPWVAQTVVADPPELNPRRLAVVAWTCGLPFEVRY